MPFLWLLFFLLASPLPAQSSFTSPEGSFKGYAWGTGRTTGHIANLVLFNPSSATLQIEIGPYLIPGSNGYQGYVIHRAQPVTIPPFGTIEVELEGYCTDVNDPAVPNGEFLTEFANWAVPEKSSPVPVPGTELSTVPGWRAAGSTSSDSLDLAYPGATVVFPHRITIDAYPASVANLIIYATNELEAAYDRMMRRGDFGSSSHIAGPDRQRSAMVQQAVWYYTSRLEENSYARASFLLQVVEQVEQSLDQPWLAFTDNATQELLEKGDALWSDILALNLEAGLILDPDSPRSPVPGGEVGTLPFFDRVEVLSPQRAGALERWYTLRNDIENAGGMMSEDAYQELTWRLNELLRIVFEQELQRLDQADFSTAATLSFMLELLDSEWVAEMDEKVWEGLAARVGEVFREVLSYRIKELGSREEVGFGDLSGLLLLFGSDELMAPVKDGFVRTQRKKLRRVYQERIISEVITLDPAGREADGKILMLKELLGFDYLTRGLGGAVQRDLLQQLNENWRLWMVNRVRTIDPATKDAFDQILNLRFLLFSTLVNQNIDYLTLQELEEKLKEKLRINLNQDILRVEVPGAEALPTLLFQLSRLARIEGLLEKDTLAGFRGLLEEKLNAQLRYLAKVPDPGSGRFLLDWRANDQLRAYWWYQAHGSEKTVALMNNRQERTLSTWMEEREGIVRSRDVSFTRIVFSDHHWKATYHTKLPALERRKKPFPLWVLGIPPAGAGVYYLLKGPKEAPPLLNANDDLILISCGNTGTINVLDNDMGEGIQLLGFGQAATAAVTDAGNGNLSISVTGTGSFSIPYNVTDIHGQMDEAVLYVQVTAPELLAVDDAFSISAANTLQDNLLSNDVGRNPVITTNTYPEGGTLAMNENGAFSFVPDDSFCGTTSFEYTVEDVCRQTATAEVTISVEDGMPPEMQCPENIIVNCDVDLEPEMTGGWATGSDNCDAAPNISYTDAISDGECAQERTVLRTWRAADAAGLYSECVQEIFQTDSAAPSISCEPIITVSCGEMMELSSLGLPEVSDNCTPEESLVLTHTKDTSGLTGCGGTGVILRTWMVTDACGNSNWFVQEINVVDNEEPELNLPPDTTVDCDQSTAPEDTGWATANDDCTPADSLTVTYQDSEDGPATCGGGMVIFRTWRVTDACGNTAEATQMITATDLTAPQITCPEDTFVSCEESIEPGFIGEPFVEDNCDPSPSLTFEDQLQSGECINERLLTRTWRATDACGNMSECAQVVTIGDVTPPNLELPPDLTIDCDAQTTPDDTGIATAMDNCSGPDFIDISYSDVVNSDGCAAESVILRTWTATDPCGNTLSGVQKITRTSGGGSVFICPPNTIIDCSEPALPELTGFPDLTGGCGNTDGFQTGYIDELIPSAGSIFTIRRTWIVTDSCGFSSQCIQLILVQNTGGATVACPPDVTIECPETPDPAQTGTPEITDNCYLPDEVIWDYVDDASGLDGCGGTGELIRNWMFVNLNGDAYTCTQAITLEDTTAPEIDCPPDLAVDVAGSLDPSETGMATAADDCGAPEDLDFSYSDDVSGLTGCGGAGVVVRTWTAADACGNMSTCTQNITLQDLEAPDITCPPEIVVEVGESIDSTVTGIPVAEDNATGLSDLTFQYADDLNDLDVCGGTGTIVRTWTVTDLCGNFATCTQLITLEDTTAPELVCPPDISVDCSADLSPGQTGQATATDNGSAPGDIDIQYADNLDSLTACNGTGFLQRTWTATDACGNADTCVQIITVTDNVPPMIDCPLTANVLCGQQFDTGITGEATATDNCGSNVDLTFTDDLTSFDGCEGAILRTWTATDVCGNIAICEQSVLVTEVVCDFTPTFDTSPADCDQANGSITVALDPPGDYTLEWETGDTGNQIDELAGGAYAVTITDNANACSQVFQVVVDQGEGDLADLIDVLPSDCGDSGDILLNLFGGDAFQVQVSGPNSLILDDQPSGLLTLSDFMDVPPGLYTIQVTGTASGCTEVLTADVTSQAPFMLSLETFTDPSTPGASDGTITIRFDPAFFLLDIYVNGDYYSTEALPVFTIENLPAGTYTIYAVDHNNPVCQSNSVVVTLTDPADLWTPEWTAAPDPRYLPAALIQSRLFSNWLGRPGFEGPGSTAEWSQDYRLRSFSGSSLVYHPGRSWEVRFDLFQFGGDGRLWRMDRNAPGIRGATDVRADFQGLTAGLSVRFHPLRGRWQPWLGGGLAGSSWRSEYATGVDPREVQTGLDGWPYLSGGLRWSVWKKLAVELDLLIRATEGGGKRHEVLPGLRGRWRW